MIVELVEKAMRRQKAAGWRPPLLEAQRVMFRRARPVDSVARRQKPADWRPPLFGVRQVRATRRRALFVLAA
jgi:hypothetical protein